VAIRKRNKKLSEPAAAAEPDFVRLPDSPIAAAPRVETVTVAPPPVGEFIMVKAVGSNQYEPFQRIAIPSDHAVPVKRSNWVNAQLRAGVIVLVN
jgi:hypothetical protein